MLQRISGVPIGYESFALDKLLKKYSELLIVVPNDKRMSFLQETFSLMLPGQEVLSFPAWDTVPYDRAAPKPEIVGQRIDTLTRLARRKKENPEKRTSLIILTTTSALMQKVPEESFFDQTTLEIKEGDSLPFDTLKSFLVQNGYHTTNTVMEVGEFAVRGGLIDIFLSGFKQPIRMDFFGDEIDSIKNFDPLTQRTTTTLHEIVLKTTTEFILTPETISRFRTQYRSLFDKKGEDPFYEAVSEGHYIQGLEHFLPLFHQELVPLWSYLSDYAVIQDFQASDSYQGFEDQVHDYYEARQIALKGDLFVENTYQPIPINLLFFNKDQIEAFVNSSDSYLFSPFLEDNQIDAGGRSGHDFVENRLQEEKDVFCSVVDYVKQDKRKIVFSASTEGSCQRLAGLLRDHGMPLNMVDSFEKALKKAPSIIVAPFEKGFSNRKFLLITETDIMGDRIIRPVKKKKNLNFISDVSSLNLGDLVVHQKHGVGQFKGLIQIEISGATHDCLCIAYEGGDKLFVPVENVDDLSRYGNSEHVSLDKLGSTAFLTRKERVKKDLFAMAEKLIGVASQRALNKTERILPPHGLYQEFCARFPYSETDDQLRTIHEIEDDFALGKPMDRLVCGDVGFGKTEVAMRAAFLAVMSGYQVAMIAPTTLLARQHVQNFKERFQGFPVHIAGLSRLVSASQSKKIKEDLQKGTLDIIVGTHALLSKKVQFNKLGLVIVDEEQHFGVAHKERLKEIKKGVHVLTLTATPIPRTLQLSLAGVRELSVIATPPVDRLAVKTFVMPFDPVIIKEAILREHFRGGQIFFVCPRISDMKEISVVLGKIVPDLRVVQAHGQMAATRLEEIMTDFSDRKYDILLATSIIESGLDISSVNTIIVHRADMFGLAALYQLRGRVGRGKLRAYAYLTTPMNQCLSETAQKRLTVMQSLDSLGAGFALASHDLDIRGAGNLLGQEQSGHIREVGVSLYQKMLADAIQSLRRQKKKGLGGVTPQENSSDDEDYSPQISIGLPVLIPETYISDLDVRMSLYHRIGEIKDLSEIESLKAELIDRFGNYPIEVNNLFMTIELKILAKSINIERLEAGPKGGSIAFRNNVFPNPAGLISYISSQMGTIRIRPDQKLIVMRPWENIENRLKGIRNMIKKLSEIASGT